MFQPVFTGLYIDALDFRSEARELIDAFDEIEEVGDCGLGPTFARMYAENAWRIWESAFKSDAAFRFGEVDEIAVASHVFELCFLRIHHIFWEVVSEEELLLQGGYFAVFVEIMHFLAQTADGVSSVFFCGNI